MYLNPSELMHEMLEHWLDTAVDPRPSWGAVVTALRSPIVDKKNLAEQLELKYCPPVYSLQGKSPTAQTWWRAMKVILLD